MYYKIIIEVESDYEVKKIRRFLKSNFFSDDVSIMIEEIFDDEDDEELIKLLTKIEDEKGRF